MTGQPEVTVRSQKIRRNHVRSKLIAFSALAILVVAIGLFAPFLCPYDPYAQDLSNALQPPSAEHWAGTDRYGRDLFSRIIVGSQSSIFSTLALVAIIAVVGTVIGVLCGWKTGKLDVVLMRTSDVFLAFPGLVFALAIAGVLGGGMLNAVLALAAISWPKYARIARGLTLAQKNEAHLAAARLAGCSTAQLIFKHILPNIAGPLLVTAMLDIGTMMMELAGLSFLGLGAQPPMAEWGSMMSDNRGLLQIAPWTVIGPGIAIFIAVMIFNLLGDTIRDYMDSANRAQRKGRGGKMKTVKQKRNGFAILAVMLAAVLAVAVVGCGNSSSSASGSASATGEKTFVYGTTGYGVQMEDNGLNPHDGYFGWSCLRYGVGETLFKFSDAMEAEPWLATGYEFIDDTHVKITLRDGVKFSSGRVMDGEAVKECLDDLIAVHDRAPSDMKIANVTTEGNTVTIETSEPCPAIINYLCDPYGCIIDMQAGVTGQSIVAGTGPYIATDLNDNEITLKKNDNYWDGQPKVDKVIVRCFTDADSLQSALQAGEVNATYGLAYASYALFQNSNYNISDCFTSRVFFGQANYESAIMQDEAVRTALAMGIDKEGFVKTLLNGRGQAAKGPFPAAMKFGDNTVTTESYDPEGAKKLLELAGWVDSDGDGIREKDGQKLTIRWLTYPSRLELPLLAESAQATLKEIGFDVQVNSTGNFTEIRKDKSAWDVYVSALVTAPTGDPEYFFRATCMTDSSKNYGGYKSEKLDELATQLHSTFDADERAKLATQMSQTILDDHGYFFASFLQMGIVSQSNVQGMVAHPCDYYEITVDLDV